MKQFFKRIVGLLSQDDSIKVNHNLTPNINAGSKEEHIASLLCSGSVTEQELMTALFDAGTENKKLRAALREVHTYPYRRYKNGNTKPVSLKTIGQMCMIARRALE